ncbi:uncharacterized protein NPIL_510841 [Nephila pilipes]|uniref:CUB domain-containing protein n=1 Tax=Nephila pilipes TaxID=299642 RepID=A0A8X6PK96_NEPPI|nr:uncharacterized protein NPIL_510841 [Nephila pilipes]
MTFLFLSEIAITWCRDCRTENAFSGKIQDSTNTYEEYEKCWIIIVPRDNFIAITLNSFTSSYENDNIYVMISVAGTGEKYKFLSSDKNRNPVTALSNTTVIFHGNRYGNYYSMKFDLTYNIKTLECSNKDSFQCDDTVTSVQSMMVSKTVKNGSDELGVSAATVRSVILSKAIEGVKEFRERNAVNWLENNKHSLNGVRYAGTLCSSIPDVNHEERVQQSQWLQVETLRLLLVSIDRKLIL